MFFTFQPIEWPNIIILAVFLIPISIIDAKYFRVPNILVIAGSIILFAVIAVTRPQTIPVALVHGATAFAVIFLFWFFSKKHIGLGDAKLSFFIAAGAGFLEWWGILFFASVFALIYALVRISIKKMKKDDKIPLAPFFALGFFVIILLKSFLFRDITLFY
jgi:prepilin signal peptidase PulO-like enzyme (type II secretory pathway)